MKVYISWKSSTILHYHVRRHDSKFTKKTFTFPLDAIVYFARLLQGTLRLNLRLSFVNVTNTSFVLWFTPLTTCLTETDEGFYDDLYTTGVFRLHDKRLSYTLHATDDDIPPKTDDQEPTLGTLVQDIGLYFNLMLRYRLFLQLVELDQAGLKITVGTQI